MFKATSLTVLAMVLLIAGPANSGPPAKIEADSSIAERAEQRRILRVRRVRSQRRARFDKIVRTVSNEYGVRPEIVHAVIWVESAYDPKALSAKGAAGLMQLMPATAKRFGVNDRFDPYQNVGGGVAYLRELEKLYSGDLELVLAAYNAGERAVKNHGGRVPPYAETRDFVRRVLSALPSATAHCWAWENPVAAASWGESCRFRRPVAFPTP